MARSGNQFRESAQMNLNRLMRRNRFKNRAKAEKPKWQWPKFFADWRTYARRAAILAADHRRPGVRSPGRSTGRCK